MWKKFNITTKLTSQDKTTQDSPTPLSLYCRAGGEGSLRSVSGHRNTQMTQRTCENATLKRNRLTFMFPCSLQNVEAWMAFHENFFPLPVHPRVQCRMWLDYKMLFCWRKEHVTLTCVVSPQMLKNSREIRMLLITSTLHLHNACVQLTQTATTLAIKEAETVCQVLVFVPTWPHTQVPRFSQGESTEWESISCCWQEDL